MNYFTHLSNILETMIELGVCPPALQEILVTERSRDRFTIVDLANAATTLGFGPDGALGVEYDTDIPESFIEGAWRECVKRSWKDHHGGPALLRDATQAFRTLAEARGSAALMKIWESGKDKLMNPERAYDTLEVPKDVEEFMLITIYNMRVSGWL
jgi:ubiquitin carboxyl-terminal hydrolase 25/28